MNISKKTHHDNRHVHTYAVVTSPWRKAVDESPTRDGSYVIVTSGDAEVAKWQDGAWFATGEMAGWPAYPEYWTELPTTTVYTTTTEGAK